MNRVTRIGRSGNVSGHRIAASGRVIGTGEVNRLSLTAAQTAPETVMVILGKVDPWRDTFGN